MTSLLTPTARASGCAFSFDLGPVGEAIQQALARRPFLGRLLGHAHALPDHRPGRTGPARLVDEVPDQVIGELVEVVGDGARVGKVVKQGSVRPAADCLRDQLIQRHSVNLG